MVENGGTVAAVAAANEEKVCSSIKSKRPRAESFEDEDEGKYMK
jgi:hypothetical protein